MRYQGRVLRDAAIGAPGAVATGVGRALASNAVNPGLAGVPVAKQAWFFNGAALGVGVLGAILGAATGEEDWYEATEGVLQSGLAYTSEDATHEINRLTKKPAASTTAPSSVMRVAQPAAPVRRVAGGGAAPAAAVGGGSLFAGV